MKIAPIHYAKAYFELMNQATDAKKRTKITNNFVKFLSKNNVLKNSNQIVANLKDLVNQTNQTIEAKIISAHDIKNDKKLITEIEKILKKHYDCKRVEFSFAIDENLISGVLIKTKNETINLSLKNQIINLKHKLKEI